MWKLLMRSRKTRNDWSIFIGVVRRIQAGYYVLLIDTPVLLAYECKCIMTFQFRVNPQPSCEVKATRQEGGSRIPQIGFPR